MESLGDTARRLWSSITARLLSTKGPPHPSCFDHSPRVLCILAEEPEANIARHFLERKGCRVTIVSDGHQGLELARLEHPDVVVLDVLTSGMDGFRVYNVMKADAQLSQIPLVFIDRGRLSPWPGAHQSPDVISFPDPQGLARAIEYVISHKSEAPTLAPNTQPSDAEH